MLRRRIAGLAVTAVAAGSVSALAEVGRVPMARAAVGADLGTATATTTDTTTTVAATTATTTVTVTTSTTGATTTVGDTPTTAVGDTTSTAVGDTTSTAGTTSSTTGMTATTTVSSTTTETTPAATTTPTMTASGTTTTIGTSGATTTAATTTATSTATSGTTGTATTSAGPSAGARRAVAIAWRRLAAERAARRELRQERRARRLRAHEAREAWLAARADRATRARATAWEQALVRAREVAAAQRTTSTADTAAAGVASESLDGVVPARDIALSRLSALLADGDRPPAFLVRIDKQAARRYHVPWTILAAINAVETDYGRDLRTSSAGAEGWMQFMPSTWARWAVTTGHHTRADPDDPRAAILTAARYLHASGAPRHIRRALFVYNHADWYVDEVLLLSERIAAQTHESRGVKARLGLMLGTAHLLNGLPYRWGGGHSGWSYSTGYDCSGFVSALLHAAGYLHTPQTTQTLPDQRGLENGPGRWVTIFDRTDAGVGDDHVIIEIDGQWWESGGSSTAGGGADVHRIRTISAAYLATFNRVLHPRGL